MIGTVLKGYRVAEKVKDGGTGSVYRAVNAADKSFAIKISRKLDILSELKSSSIKFWVNVLLTRIISNVLKACSIFSEIRLRCSDGLVISSCDVKYTYCSFDNKCCDSMYA